MKAVLNSVLSLVLILFVSMISSFGQAGTLDLSFGTGGRVKTNISAWSGDYGRAVIVQPDGKIVVVGETHQVGYTGDVAVFRYNPDGSLDLSFDSDGIAITDLGDSTDIGWSVALQSDGKIVVGGTTGRSSYRNIAVVRYNINGSLDNLFDSDGKVVTDIGGQYNEGLSIALQSDGKIVVSGTMDNDLAVVRYNSNGSLDNTFDGDGIVFTDFGPNDHGNSVKIQNDGKIVVGGYYFAGASNTNFILARYNSDGSLDNTFDLDGKVVTSFGLSGHYGYSLAIQDDGKILLGGTVVSSTRFAIARYNLDGSLDITFDGDGKLIYDFVGTNYDNCKSILYQGDGKIILTGFVSVNGFPPSAAAMARINSDGSVDNTFDLDGAVTTNLDTAENYTFASALQPDGKILLVGYYYKMGVLDVLVFRYNNNIVGIGIDEIDNNNLKVYPNPSSTSISLQLNGTIKNGSLNLLNVSGDVVHRYVNLNGSLITLDISAIAKGMYIIHLSDGQQNYFGKVIKE